MGRRLDVDKVKKGPGRKAKKQKDPKIPARVRGKFRDPGDRLGHAVLSRFSSFSRIGKRVGTYATKGPWQPSQETVYLFASYTC